MLLREIYYKRSSGMLNKKILIAALTLALCATAFTSCGRNTEDESGSGSTDSITESTASETESGNKETTGESNTESSGTGTNGTTGTTGTEGTGTNGTTGTEGTGTNGTTGTEGAGGIVGRIGNDVQNGMNNVKRGVEDIFGGEGAAQGERGHRPPVPYGK